MSNTVRVALIPTESGYRVRPAVALAYAQDKIRFLNLTSKKVRLELSGQLRAVGEAQAQTAKDGRQAPIWIEKDGRRDVEFVLPDGTPEANPIQHGERWRIHYSVFLENGSPIPGESSPEIIIDQEP